MAHLQASGLKLRLNMPDTAIIKEVSYTSTSLADKHVLPIYLLHYKPAPGMRKGTCIWHSACLVQGKLQGWWYTNNEGVLTRASLHEISPQGLFQKLVGQKTEDPAMNPFQYIALAHCECPALHACCRHTCTR